MNRRPPVHPPSCYHSQNLASPPPLSLMKDSPDDIIDVLQALREDDAEAERIGRRGREFVLQHLHRQARWCYWREVLVRAGARDAGRCEVRGMRAPAYSVTLMLLEGGRCEGLGRGDIRAGATGWRCWSRQVDRGAGGSMGASGDAGAVWNNCGRSCSDAA